MRVIFIFSALLCISIKSFAVTVQDSKGSFSIDYIPQRIVTLEYSFVDALAIVNVSPIGIADDKDASRILPQIRDIIGDWTSVGTRSQPSLEMISSLKPDLIIADIDRHLGVYDELQKIAPTLILKSRRETYKDHIHSARVIGKVVGKDAQMQARLAQHDVTMKEIAEQLPQGIEVQFGIALDNRLSLHPGQSYVGTLMQFLGFKTPPLLKDHSASVHTNLEQLLASNPEHLIIGHYYSPDILDDWQKEPLWSLLQAVQKQQLYHVSNPGTWSRSRGILAAEVIGQELLTIFTP